MPSPPGLGYQAKATARHAPLVIVSESGRHSEASRRIVRAQAARASAAQSRETRARNRGDRQIREITQSPARCGHGGSAQSRVLSRSTQAQQLKEESDQNERRPSKPPHTQLQLQQQQQSPPSYQRPSTPHHAHVHEARLQSQSQPHQFQYQSPDHKKNSMPLMWWVNNVLQSPSTLFKAGCQDRDSPGAVNAAASDGGRVLVECKIKNSPFSRQLPIALPRGFALLQTKILISHAFLQLLSRTACFDFASSGVELRLNELLFDVTMEDVSVEGGERGGGATHPIQNYLRIACVCLTIFQGQRAECTTFTGNQNYNMGLRAAWDEALGLDQHALRESYSAEAALWAVFIITVTCGSTLNFFHQLLLGLLEDLQLQYWAQVRDVLLKFIYPGSSLDEPCKRLYMALHQGPIGVAAG